MSMRARVVFAVLLGVTGCGTVARSVHAQASPPSVASAAANPIDSAAAYLKMADSLMGASNGPAPAAPALALARRALALFAQRNDSAGQGRAYNAIAWAHYRVNRDDSTLANGRRALSLVSARDTLISAQANEAVGQPLLRLGAPLDSAMQYLSAALMLRRQMADPRVLQYGLVDIARTFTERSRLLPRMSAAAKDALSDSTLKYYHASIRRGLAGGDSSEVADAYWLIGLEWSRRGRNDSVLVYSRRAWDISSVQQNAAQMFREINSIMQAYRWAGPDPSVGIDLDSALAWARRGYETARTLDTTRQPGWLTDVSRTLNEMGRLDSARFYGAQAVSLARERNNLTVLQSSLGWLVVLYDQQGFRDSSVLVRRDLILVAQQRASDRSLAARRNLLSSWLDLGNAHRSADAPDSARVWLRRVIDSTTTDTTFSSVVSSAWSTLGWFELGNRRADSALTAFRQLEKLVPLIGQPTAAEIQVRNAWMGAGRAYLQRGDVDSAVTLFTRVLRRDSVGAQAADAWLALADVHVATGQLDSALVHRRRALQISQRNPNNRQTQTYALSSIGSVFRLMALMDSALVVYRQALAISTKDNDRVSVANMLQGLSYVFMDSDVLDSALFYARRGVALADAMGVRQRQAILHNHFGLIYNAIGQRDSARIYFERAVASQRLLGSPAGEAGALSNLASVHQRAGRNDSALVLLKSSLAIREQSQDRLGGSATRLVLALVQAQRGQIDEALREAREVLEISRPLRFRDLEGRALAGVGRVFALAGQADSARYYLSEAAAILRRIGFNRGLREVLAELAEAFRRDESPGSLARATAYFDTASTVVDNARRGAGGDENEVALSEAQVDLFGGWARAWAGRATDVGAVRSAASALAAVERGRAQSLVDMVTRLESSSRAAATALNRVEAGADLALESDALLSPLRASRSAALSYLLAGDTLFTWLLTPDGALQLQQPVALTETELNRLVRSARRAFSADDARTVRMNPDELAPVNDSTTIPGNPSDDWKRLAELLLPPELTNRVPPGTPIVIVPHGSIALVPFSALSAGRDTTRRTRRAPSDPRPTPDTTTVSLGERNPLRYAPSFAALRASETRARVSVTPALRTPAAQRAWRASRGAPADSPADAPAATAARAPRTVATAALVVGNPTMPYVYSGRWTNRSRLQPLPGAEAESRTIAEQLGASALTGRAATETAIRKRMTSAPLIHFATHGLAYGTASAARRSFVAFAPDSAQDGLLTLGELMDDRALTLTAELVVLSACQTGLGDMKKAEGSIGLQRAFLAKGARSVLVSLWNVDDKATRLLMEKFYAYWLDPTVVRTKAQSLQMAQEAVRRTPGYADPKYWAAFQLVGAD